MATTLKHHAPSLGQKAFGQINQAMAAIVAIHQTDRQFHEGVMPRDPVVLQVMRIRHALDELIKVVPRVDFAAQERERLEILSARRLPDRMPRIDLSLGEDLNAGKALGWNACLDAIAEVRTAMV